MIHNNPIGDCMSHNILLVVAYKVRISSRKIRDRQPASLKPHPLPKPCDAS